MILEIIINLSNNSRIREIYVSYPKMNSIVGALALFVATFSNREWQNQTQPIQPAQPD